MAMRLDAERGDDQVRVEVDFDPDDPLGQIRGLRAAIVQLEVWQREAIALARQVGASWSEVGEALGVTKQAAWATYNQGVRTALEDARSRSELSDEQAQQLADEERERRRSHSG